MHSGKPSVFISHASEIKKDFVLPLEQDLQQLGCSVFVDQTAIAYGDSFVTSINKGLSEADVIIVVFDKNFLKKKWTNAEIQAIQNLVIENGKKLIPIYYRMAPEVINSLYPLISSIKGIKVSEKGDLGLIRNAIRKILKNSEESDRSIMPRMKFLAIAGPSAVGKDSLLEKLREEYKFKDGYRFVLLRKYTDRKKRFSEAEYYTCLNSQNFKKYLQNGEILFPYSKRGINYGFSRSQFEKLKFGKSVIACVFTDFDNLPQIRNFLRTNCLKSTLVLLTGDERYLIARSRHRNFTGAEISSRIDSIKEDIFFINKNKRFIGKYFDLVLDSGDGTSKNSLFKKLKDFLDKNF